MFRRLLATAIFASPLAAGPVSMRGVALDDSPKSTIAGELTIDWLEAASPVTEFKQRLDPAHGIAESTYRLGDTHITRTLLVSEKDDAIFLHFIADKPGDLSFRATLNPPGKGTTTIEDRREIFWNDPENPARKSRVWVIPFESDVETEGRCVVLRGEGECLLILKSSAAEDPAKTVAETWKRLAATYDPGANPPDPVKIWQAILARATAD